MTTPPGPAPQLSGEPTPEPPTRVPVLSNRAIVLAAIVLAIVGTGLVTVLLVFLGGSGNTDQHQTQLDAIKTAGTIVVGTGGAFALWLTARRQRTSEITVNQKAEDQAAVDRAFALQQAQADAALADAEARRITEQYGRAVDQLGSEKAAVRLGGLYALERLAQDNPGQRPTIVAVICAYLRMPYQLPGEQPDTNAAPAEHIKFEERTQEQQVRITAQRILADHLRPGADPENPTVWFWPDTVLDLTGATLINLDLSSCCATVRFGEAIFTGHTEFSWATFTIGAVFSWATFTDSVEFDDAMFSSDAVFSGATFASGVRFENATFSDTAWFIGTTFADIVEFGGAGFTGDAQFDEATFTGEAEFGGVTFSRDARFTGATFTSDARFTETTFTRDAQFNKATFTGDARFDGGWVSMAYSGSRSWPSGWSVVPASSPARPEGVTEDEWGRLVTRDGSDPAPQRPRDDS